MSATLVESTAQGLVGTDEAGRITLFSAAAEGLLGARSDEVLGEDFYELFVPERLRKLSREGMLRLAHGGAPTMLGRTFTAPVVTSGGEERLLAMTLLESGPPPTRYVACFSAEPAAVVEFDASPSKVVGLFTVGARDGALEMSDALWRMHGVTESPGSIPVGAYIERFVHPLDRSAVQARVKDRETGRGVEALYSWRVVTVAGEVRTLLSEGRAALADDGSVEQTIAVVRDVTATEGTQRALLAHRTVNTALDAWDEPRGGVVGVLRDLVEAMGWTSGAMWRRDGDTGALVCVVYWVLAGERGRAPAESEVRSSTVEIGEGVVGRAWSAREVTADGCGSDGLDEQPEIAVPVVLDGVTLAVLHFGVSAGRWLSDELRRAMTEIGRGRLAEFFGRHRADIGLSPLTDREQQVLQLAANGGAISTIADALGISASTVKTHFEHIYDKLAVSDRGGAVAEGFRQGLVT